MGNFSANDISSSGLFAQRTRLDVIANNIANAETTRTEDGGPYKRQQVVFSTALETAKGMKPGEGVNVDGITEDTRSPRMVYQPGHPDANAEGYVAMPNVNMVEEMVDMISATRAYEANVTALNAAKSMIASALELGRG
jgi:flagellar basal-body rod protein FlgC